MNLPEVVMTLKTTGWRESIDPAIRERMQRALLQLASATRSKDVSDDMLRGHIAALGWVLEFPQRTTRALQALEDDAAEKAAPPKDEIEGIGTPHEPESE